MRRPKYQPQKVVYVDVDGTLLIDGKCNNHLVAVLTDLKAEGYELILWSARGKEHAQKAAGLTRTVGLFDIVLTKPGYVVDDKGWTWTRFVKCLPLGPSGA